MPTLEIQINDCSDCPFLKVERHYTSDSFEIVFDWKCDQNNGLHIATLDWNDKSPAIPTWCPILRKDVPSGPTC